MKGANGMEKEQFTREYIEPAVKAALPSVQAVEYYTSKGLELLFIQYTSGKRTAIDVTGDSELAMLYDVTRKLLK